jgi:hypothetical protein
MRRKAPLFLPPGLTGRVMPCEESLFALPSIAARWLVFRLFLFQPDRPDVDVAVQPKQCLRSWMRRDACNDRFTMDGRDQYDREFPTRSARCLQQRPRLFLPASRRCQAGSVHFGKLRLLPKDEDGLPR